MERKKEVENKGEGSKEKLCRNNVQKAMYECFSCHSETTNFKTYFILLIFEDILQS